MTQLFSDFLQWKPCISKNVYLVLLSVSLSLTTHVAKATDVGNGKTYPTLKSAFDAINNGTLTGDIVLEITSDITETNTALLYNSGSGGSSYTSVLIRPQGGAWTISGTFSDGNNGTRTSIIQLWGAKNVTVDGRIDGTGSTRSLTIANLANNSWGYTYAFRFNNDASNNTIRYCNIKARNGSTSNGASGMVIFQNGVMTGNDNNTIDRCFFDGEGIARVGWHTASGMDDNLVISNNEFKNVRTHAAWVYAVGNNHTVSGNSIYWTASPPSGYGIMTAFYLQTLNGGMTIENNYIGGSEPLCGGTAVMNIGSTYFCPILVSGSVPNNQTLSIQGNTIASFDITTMDGGNASGFFTAIAISSNSNGNSIINIGNISGNTIGSTTAAGSIVIKNGATYQGSNAYVCGIKFNGYCGRGTISNNRIGGIKIPVQAGPSTYLSFQGISSGQPGVSIINNTIGSTTVANSIENSSGNSATTQSFQTYGIQNLSTLNALTTEISGNTIANMTNNAAGTKSVICGINATGSYSTANLQISGNTINDLYTQSVNTGYNTSPSMAGIVAANATSVSGNTIYNLYQQAASEAVTVYGVANTQGAPTVSKNYIHHISMASPDGIIKGVFSAGYMSLTVANNMIHLGTNPEGSSITAGATIHGLSFSGPALVYNNTIYIGGSSVVSKSPTAVVQSINAFATNKYINNIFVNNRSNMSGTARNSIYLFSGNPSVGIQISNNLYQNNGAGSFFAVTGLIQAPVFSAWRTLNNLDLNSGETDPMFKMINMPSSSLNMHLQLTNPAEGRGAVVAAVTEDMSGTTRDASTPDIGAEEGSFVQSTTDIAPPVISFTDLTDRPVSGKLVLADFATITDDVSVTAGAGGPRLYYKRSTNANAFGGNTSGDDGWKYVTATNTTSPYSFEMEFSRLDGGAVLPGDVIQYFVAAQDDADHLASYPAVAGTGSYPAVENINYSTMASMRSFTVSTALPITLVSFTGTSKDGINYLKWVTSSETNNKYFEIERSADGVSFTAIGQVKGGGDAVTDQHYAFNDNAPLNGANFYRLKQVDIDGKFSRSKTITLKNSDMGASVSPNPAVDFVKVRFESRLNNAAISLVSLTGQTVFQKSGVSGHEYRIDLSGVTRGTYLLQVKDGVREFVTKIIKR